MVTVYLIGFDFPKYFSNYVFYEPVKMFGYSLFFNDII